MNQALQKLTKPCLWWVLFTWVWLFMSTPLRALEETGEVHIPQGGRDQVTLMVNGSGIIHLAALPERITLANPEVADLKILDRSRVFVLGKQIGSTAVMAFDRKDQLLARLHIEVTPDLDLLKRRLFEVMPKEIIEVRTSGNNLVLSGEVDNLTMLDTAIRIAQGFVAAPEQIINMLSVGGAQQVMLEVKVAEMQRSLLKKLEVNVAGLGADGNWQFGGVGSSGGSLVPGGDVTLNPISMSGDGLFGSFMSGDDLVGLYIDASKDTGTARILAEPTLVTLSGEDASFISGGEFPVPVPQGDNNTTVEFKEYGIGLNFLPVVMDSGRINLRLNLSVSELNGTQSLVLGGEGAKSSFVVPYLSKRSARSTVELMDGQTIGVAGLISENMRDGVQKFPGLGDVPVLGHLFRSQEYQSGQTELVILVTPRLAKPLAAEAHSLPTDTFVAPSDVSFYLGGNTSKRFEIPAQQSTTTGVYGHDIHPESSANHQQEQAL